MYEKHWKEGGNVQKGGIISRDQQKRGNLEQVRKEGERKIELREEDTEEERKIRT